MSKKRNYARDMLRPAIRQAGADRGIPFTDDEFEQVLDAYEQGDVGTASTMIKWLQQVPLHYQAHQRRLAPLRSVSAAYKLAQIPSHLRKDNTDGLSRQSTQKAARRTPQPPDPRGDGGAQARADLYDWLDVTGNRLIASAYYPPLVQQQLLYQSIHQNSYLAAGIGQFLVGGHSGPLYADLQPAPDPLPTEVKAGELVAWRCWRKDPMGKRLVSMSMDTEWKVGETVEGDPTIPSQGVHAFKTEAKAREYARGEYCDIAVGTVELWGTVIEHEDGYRAQYGAIKEIVDTVPAHPHATMVIPIPTASWFRAGRPNPGGYYMVPPTDGEGLSAVILGIVLGTTALLSLLVVATKLWG